MAYFPNGSAGDVLDNQCFECLHRTGDDTCCPVFFVQNMYNYDQCDESQKKLRECLTHLVADDGTCKQREAIEKANAIIPLTADDLATKSRIDDYAEQFNVSFIEAREKVEWMAGEIAEALEPHE